MNGKKSHNLRVFSNFLSFLAVVIVAVLTIVSHFLSPETNLSAVLMEISKILMCAVISISSFWYVLSKRSIVYKVIWVVCVVGIFVFAFI